MNLFQKAIAGLNNKVNGSGNPGDPFNQALYEFYIREGNINIMPDNEDSYIKNGYTGNADIYSIIGRITSMRKQAPLKLYKRDPVTGKRVEVVEDHPLKSFLKKANPSMLMSEYLDGFLIYRLVCGEAFTYTPVIDAGANRGKVFGLYLMPSNEVEIIEGNMFEPVRGYRIGGNYNVEMPAAMVYHSKMFNPEVSVARTLHGLSPIKAAARIVMKQNQAEDTQLKQFENQGAPYLLFKDNTSGPQGKLTTEQQDTIQKKIKDHGRDPEKRRLPLVMKEKYGVLPIGSSISDLNIIESSRDGRRILCNVYAFPVDLMNDPEGSTYNNKSTARRAAWTDCIIPNLKVVETALNEMIIENVPEYKDYSFKFDYSEVEELQEGMDIKVGWMRKAGYTMNEIREATGKSAINEDYMNEPVFAQGDLLGSDMAANVDNPLAKSDYSDYFKDV